MSRRRWLERAKLSEKTVERYVQEVAAREREMVVLRKQIQQLKDELEALAHRYREASYRFSSEASQRCRSCPGVPQRIAELDAWDAAEIEPLLILEKTS